MENPNRIHSLFILSCIFMMEIFFPCRQTTADMTFSLIHFQHRPDGFGQFGVDPLHSVCNILMHCGFGNAELLRRLPHGGVGMDHKFRYFDRPFLNICFQTKHSSYSRLVMYMLQSIDI